MASQYDSTAGATHVGSLASHAAHGVPHASPAQGSPLHPVQPISHVPRSHTDRGQLTEPSGHWVHGAPDVGQSASLAQVLPAQPGKEPTHTPFSHAAVGHA